MWSRASAGLVPGFLLAVALTGLAAYLPPGPWQGAVVPALLAFAPIWVGVFGGAFLFADGRRAWLWLGLAAAAAFALLWGLRTLGWAR